MLPTDEIKMIAQRTQKRRIGLTTFQSELQGVQPNRNPKR